MFTAFDLERHEMSFTRSITHRVVLSVQCPSAAAAVSSVLNLPQ